MSDALSRARERSRRRKELIKHTLGVADLGQALGRGSGSTRGPPPGGPSGIEPERKPSGHLEDGEVIEAKRARAEPLTGVTSGETRAEGRPPRRRSSERSVDVEEFRDSKAFLKGTQSLNPHNDYSQNFVDTGHRPQNFIRDVGLADRFEEYPKLRELIRLKNDLVARTAHPPMYLKADLETHDLKQLGQKFDVILIEPPLEEYARSYGVTNVKFWDWERIMGLDISEVAANRSFIFLWCGSSDGLDLGRLCLQNWGFRRCEDICWIQTNMKNKGKKALEPNAVCQRTKEHCLMGIKGTVRRSTDGDFIHANVDIDLIIDEEPEPGSLDKPIEMFHIIEHFCLGRRRLHLFGRDSTIRPGWLTLGEGLTMSNYDESQYHGFFTEGTTTGCSDRIESLRPKSPPLKSGQRGRGGGRGKDLINIVFKLQSALVLSHTGCPEQLYLLGCDP
eukprot:maker-scaffold169_size292178-snap-gene-1.32 protein:Tk07933 transcript:maker-scaffold169_size292178-snap-gene-1.32-mRNA-1 annotation:"hypothetical protein D910_06178"